MASVWECSRNDVLEGCAVIAAALGVWIFKAGWPDLVIAVALLLLFARSGRRASCAMRPVTSRNAANFRPMIHFLSELRRRNVVRMALLYIATGWGTAPGVELPPRPIRISGLDHPAHACGARAAVSGLCSVFAWNFELTPEGLRRVQEAAGDTDAKQGMRRRINLAIVALFSIVIGRATRHRRPHRLRRTSVRRSQCFRSRTEATGWKISTSQTECTTTS